jgi:hypothetical protein
MEKTGIVKYVAVKTGGIQLEDSPGWLNATPKAKESVTSELRGKKVILSMINPKNFDSVKVLEEGVIDQKQQTSTKPTRNELLIARQVAIKAAADLVNTQKDLIDLAEAIERWILR